MKPLTAVLITATAAFTFLQCNSGGKKSAQDAQSSALGTGPFSSHRDSVPSASQYAAPLFTLSHNYPSDPMPPLVNPPWQQALKGQPLGKDNALAYVEGIKQYVSSAIEQYLKDPASFNADSAGYYEEPWTGSLREAVLGTYVGSGFGPETFSSLDSNMTTYVLTMYDKRAAYTLHNIWGESGEELNLKDNAAQFQQGSVIVKFAFTTANFPQWSVMQNAWTHPIYDTGTAYPDPRYQMRDVTFFQFDMIVKDTINAPKTGWVFTTLVYDKNADGATAWDRMVPLGAQWGNDPDVNSTTHPGQPLKENVINPKAPEYSRQTLGWGDRMSGPNDGAVIPWASANGKVYHNLQASSCMSCHLTAQKDFNAFLLPAPFPTTSSDTLPVFEPGGPDWVRWFRDLPGDVPFDSGQVGLDFDMVTAFKSIPLYQSARKLKVNKAELNAAERFRQRTGNRYNGR